MKVLSLFCIVFSVAEASSLFNQDYDEQWEGYKKSFGRNYGTKEEGARRVIWEQNVKAITKHNLEADIGLHSFWMGVNKFADMTPKEILRIKSCLIRTTDKSNATKVFRHPVDAPLPSSVDWRKQGYVTDIKDQGMCGSCWAFSATGSLEGQHKASTGDLVSLSEQNLVDCSWKEGNEGCDGGLMDKAFEYIKKNKGIDTEDSYPYTGDDGKCKYRRSSIGATCKGFVDVMEGNETSLQAAVALVGPISVAIDASSDKFTFYKSGIFDDPKCSRTELDHGVLAVGYGSQNGKDYWIVKNSWGTSWGEDGYILMTRNKGNQCGIATLASYPLV